MKIVSLREYLVEQISKYERLKIDNSPPSCERDRQVVREYQVLIIELKQVLAKLDEAIEKIWFYGRSNDMNIIHKDILEILRGKETA